MNCVEVTNDENMPTSSQSVEQNVKKNRRRSSIGGDLMKSFFKESEMERITTPEHNIRRNRRSAAIRADFKSRVMHNKPPILSMDVGEQANIKSCLTKKSTTTAAQKAALNIVKKYRRSRSLSRTPTNRSRNLRFNSICTVRVMTPRPQYDPDNLCLPSDDEDSRKPDRQRLSTVRLDITPESQAYLHNIKDDDNAKVEFHAQMIFGDDSNNETRKSSFSSDSTKRKRRKSLITNAASPMTTPPPLPKANAKTDGNEQEQEQKSSKRPRNCRRSLMLEQKEVAVVEERKTRRRSGLLKVAEIQVPKKEEVKKEAPKKIEPEKGKVETRSRRRSGLVVPEPSKTDRRRSNFFAPRQIAVSQDEVQVIEPNTDKKSSQKPKDAPVTGPIEAENPSTSQKPTQSVSAISSPSQPKKMFSLFSPRPSPKLPPKETCVVELVEEKPINISVCSTSSITSTGIRKEKLWGDKIPSTYCYFENTPVFEKYEVSSQKDWLSERSPTFEISGARDFEFRLKNIKNDENFVEGCSNGATSPRVHDYNIKKYSEELATIGAHSFKPQKFEELVEGADDIDQVRGWLKKWKKRVRKEAKKQELVETQKKGKRSKKSTSSDEEDSDYDVSDDEELQNPLILRGPPGVGKTAFISTLASEENMKMIGMGPDEERKGTSIKMKLTEALRSHRVISEPVGSLVRLFQNQKSVFNPKSSNENENLRKSVLDKGFQQSLVVFEHVDLLFGSLDRNGASALIEMINTAMVPVIWTCDEDYPSNSELEKYPLVISLKKKRSRVRKYCQHLVHISTGKWIEDDVMRKLANSVDNDLRALINQTHFYALNEKLPLPLTDRFSCSNGFNSNWDMEQNTDIENILSASKWNTIESKAYQYQDVLNMIPDGFLKVDLPNIANISGDKDLMKRQSDTRKQLKSAYEAFNGRYSKNNINLEMLPYLSIIDEKEQEERKKSRRYQHCFAKTMQSEYPIDADKLTGSLAAIRNSFKFST